LKHAGADLVLRTARMLTGSGMTSVKTLVDNQQDASVSPAVRRGAARDVLEMGIKYRDTVDLDQRVAALEDQFTNTRFDGPQGHV
jgi:hypothetical protein